MKEMISVTWRMVVFLLLGLCLVAAGAVWDVTRSGGPVSVSIEAISEPCEAQVWAADRGAAAAPGSVSPLTEAGPSSVQDLIEILRTGDAVACYDAAGRLADLGPAAEAAVPALIETLDNALRMTRESAAIALGGL